LVNFFCYKTHGLASDAQKCPDPDWVILDPKHWPRIFKLLRGPGIDSKESIPPAYVAWRAGTITLFLLGS
jgi:hypothetical protein